MINFNVAIEPDREVFLESWPREFRDAVGRHDNLGELGDYYIRARRMLGAIPYANGIHLPRLDAFSRIARQLGTPMQVCDITVSDQDRTTKYGIKRRRCPNHGDGDGTGDNAGSKNTLMTNYLPMAAHYGVELFTGIEVQRIEPAAGRWRGVTCCTVGADRDTDTVITASKVVIAAGTIGSTAILLRSRHAGLPAFNPTGSQLQRQWRRFLCRLRHRHTH